MSTQHRTTDKYRKVFKDKQNHSDKSTPENEVKISGGTSISRYITYTARLLLEKGLEIVHLKASGLACRDAVQVAEILRHNITGLHQENSITTVKVVDEYEPLEEGLEVVKVERNLAVLEIRLSKKQDVLRTNSIGYQAPLVVEQALEDELKGILDKKAPFRLADGEGRRRGGRGGRGGRGRGGRGRGRGRGRGGRDGGFRESGGYGGDRGYRTEGGDGGFRGGDRNYGEDRGYGGSRGSYRGGRGGNRGGSRGGFGDSPPREGGNWQSGGGRPRGGQRGSRGGYGGGYSNDRGYGGGDRSYGGGERSYGGGERSYGGGERSYGGGDRSYGGGNRGYGGDRSYGGNRGYGSDRPRGQGRGGRGGPRPDTTL